MDASTFELATILRFFIRAAAAGGVAQILTNVVKVLPFIPSPPVTLPFFALALSVGCSALLHVGLGGSFDRLGWAAVVFAGLAGGAGAVGATELHNRIKTMGQ